MRTRLRPLDGSFLRVETPNAHMHVGWSALFAPHPERPQAQRRVPQREHRQPPAPGAALPPAAGLPAAAVQRAVLGRRRRLRPVAPRDRAHGDLTSRSASRASTPSPTPPSPRRSPRAPAVADPARAAARGRTRGHDREAAPRDGGRARGRGHRRCCCSTPRRRARGLPGSEREPGPHAGPHRTRARRRGRQHAATCCGSRAARCELALSPRRQATKVAETVRRVSAVVREDILTVAPGSRR